MRAAVLLALLLAGGFLAGCTKAPSEPAATSPPETVAPVDEGIPAVTAIAEEDLPPEVDLTLEETVDLGELL